MNQLPSQTSAATEGQLVAMLRKRFEQDSGNGAQGAVIAQVRDAASFDAKRTIDAIGVSFWKSRGMTLDAFECKSSRSDFQRELNAPEKAERFCELCDRFWIVAGDNKVVRDVEELPPTWGLLVAKGSKLVQVKAAPLLREHPKRGIADLPPGFDRAFLIPLLRAATVAQRVEPEAITQAKAVAFEDAKAALERSGRDWQRMYEEMAENVREFEKALGQPLRRTYGGRTAEDLGVALRTVLEGDTDVTRLVSRLKRITEDAEQVAAHARDRLTSAEEAARKDDQGAFDVAA